MDGMALPQPGWGVIGPHRAHLSCWNGRLVTLAPAAAKATAAEPVAVKATPSEPAASEAAPATEATRSAAAGRAEASLRAHLFECSGHFLSIDEAVLVRVSLCERRSHPLRVLLSGEFAIIVSVQAG